MIYLWMATLRSQDRDGHVSTTTFDFDDFLELQDHLEETFSDYRFLITCDFVYTGANMDPRE